MQLSRFCLLAFGAAHRLAMDQQQFRMTQKTLDESLESTWRFLALLIFLSNLLNIFRPYLMTFTTRKLNKGELFTIKLINQSQA